MTTGVRSRRLFGAFVVLCRKLDLFGRELLAVDGTRLKAVNNPARNFSRVWTPSTAARMAMGLGAARRWPRRSLTCANGGRCRRRCGATERQRRSQISLTDPDARAMVTGQKTTVGYNAQMAVDAKHKLIAWQHVTNAATDMGLLASTAGAAREALGVERIDAVANMGYYKGEDIEACEASGITPYVARPERGSSRSPTPLSQEPLRLRSGS